MGKNKFWLALMLAAAFIYGLALTGCPQEPEDDDVGGEVSEEIKALPNFTGTFVEDEADALAFSASADAKVHSAISEAMSEITPPPPASTGQIDAGDQYDSNLYNGIDFSNLKSLYQTIDGKIDIGGIKAKYTAAFSDDDNYTITMTGTIDLSSGGYVIKGEFASTSKIVFEYSNETLTMYMKSDYDLSYSASYEGKGMKVVSNITIESSTTTTASITATGTYKIYDNDGVLRFNYDYDYKYP
jgi:hypothetical protein